MLIRGHREVYVTPYELSVHTTLDPSNKEYGPDLSFITLRDGPGLSNILAFGSVWNMDRNHSEVLTSFGCSGSLVAYLGTPEENCRTYLLNGELRRQVYQQTYLDVVSADDITSNSNWDYLTTKSDLLLPGFPTSFEGYSGGGVWAISLSIDSFNVHHLHDFCLVGVSFYQGCISNNERYIRAHYVESIYKHLWSHIKLI